MGPHVCSLLAVCVVACILHLAPVRSQCTTKHCVDDDNELSALTTMVARLQDTVEQLQAPLVSQGKTPVNGCWSPWSEWSPCSVTCGVGRQLKTRSCGGAASWCTGKHTESQTCSGNPCSRYNYNCADVLKDGHTTSGVYEIYLEKANTTIDVFCDMETDGGGWLVFQRRQNGFVDFNKPWSAYKEGFGYLTSEFWLGTQYLYDIISRSSYTLRIDTTFFNGSTAYAAYSYFTIAPERENYKLYLGRYHGTAGDAMVTGMAFSSKDRDHDTASRNCAVSANGGAWWFSDCGASSMNGIYRNDGTLQRTMNGINWGVWVYNGRGYYHPLKATEIKVRP